MMIVHDLLVFFDKKCQRHSSGIQKQKKNESKAWHHATDASTTSIGVDTKTLLSE